MTTKQYIWTLTKPDGSTVSGESVSESAARSQISWYSQLYRVPRADKSKAAEKARAENKAYSAASQQQLSMKTAAQRKQEERARLRQAGLIPLEVWVPKDKTEEVKEYVKELRNAIHTTTFRPRSGS